MKTTPLLLAVSILTSSLFAANSSFIQSPLTNTGADADAAGSVLSQLKINASEVIVKVSKLAPATVYQIEIGGVIEAELTTRNNGSGSVKFKTSRNRRGSLDFDPRGKLLRVLDQGTSVLEATISGAGEPAGAVVLERVNLPLGAADGVTGKARAEYRLDKKGRRLFKVELERAGTGPFELFVGGVKRGDFTTVGILSKIKFAVGSDDPGALPLDFDPRGQVIDVIRAGTVLFSSELAAQALGVNVALPRLSTSAIPSTGVDPDGHAEAKLRIDDRARKHFSVEIEDVPTGTYDLLVDGTDVGDIVVTTTTDGTEGEIEFTSGDDDGEELLLTFDPAGKVLAVKQGATTFFEGAFTPDTDNGSGTPAPEPPSDLEEFLTSTGLDADAQARADYRVDDKGRHKFSVEVEDVPVGDYTLLVAGTVRGTIRVTSTVDGIEGEIEFDTKAEPGHRRLNFDPRGQLIEIASEAGVFFSHILGSGSATTGGSGGTTVPFDITVPLLSSGLDSNATARAQLTLQPDGDLSFEVEAEDLNTGAYDVLVDGTVRGTLTVVVDGNGTRGRIEFETTPKPGELLLNFTVAGKEVVIQQSGTVYFSRTFPTP